MSVPLEIPVNDLRVAARRDDVIAAMRAFYAAVDERLARLPGHCANRGECCRFGAYGHRLYVTFLETACFMAWRHGEQAAGPDPGPVGDAAEDVCPFARGGVCTARPARPLGCRIFLCDPAARHWQGPVTEELLGELRGLHRRLDVPWFCADWMAVLAAIGLR